MERNRIDLEKACNTKRIPKKRDIYSPEKENVRKKVTTTRKEPKKVII